MKSNQESAIPAHPTQEVSHEAGFNALDFPHEDFMAQHTSEKGITAPSILKRLGRHARKVVHEISAEEHSSGFIKGKDGKPDKLIWDPNAPTYSVFDAD